MVLVTLLLTKSYDFSSKAISDTSDLLGRDPSERGYLSRLEWHLRRLRECALLNQDLEIWLYDKTRPKHGATEPPPYGSVCEIRGHFQMLQVLRAGAPWAVIDGLTKSLGS